MLQTGQKLHTLSPVTFEVFVLTFGSKQPLRESGVRRWNVVCGSL